MKYEFQVRMQQRHLSLFGCPAAPVDRSWVRCFDVAIICARRKARTFQVIGLPDGSGWLTATVSVSA